MDKDEKQFSASTTDVDAATQKSKRESDDDDSVIVILKKQRKEITEINHSLKEMSGFVKTLQENSLKKSDLEDILSKEIDEMKKEMSGFIKTLHENSLQIEDIILKVKETPNKKVEPISECCFGTKGIPEVNTSQTIFVGGFDCSLSRDDVKSTLKKHFGSCGEITRIFVPIQCDTGSPLGFAFINLGRNPQKALTLNGSVLGGLKLVVAMARDRIENSYYPNFRGCKRCSMAFHQRRFTSFIKTSGGRLHYW